METLLQVRGLRKRYGPVEALRGLDLDVGRGEVFGFLGPNGAGKTTFTKCVTGFVRPTSGEVRVLGEDAIRNPTRVAPHLGLVPDQYDFYSNLTGWQHLDFYGRLLEMPKRLRHERIDEVLRIVRMEEGAHRRVKGYSHGMKQRICIAQAILHKPKLILFDEPTNGLDPKGAVELRELIRSLARDGTTIFLNSHLLNEVEQTCERVAILDKGRLVTVAPVSQLRKRSGKGKVQVRLLNPNAKLLAAASKVVVKPKPTLTGDLLEFEGDADKTSAVIAALAAAGGQIASVEQVGAGLESAFLELTGGDA
ncbi:MAG: ABC transporter ATP-binding protein [Candidatus Thermoplasmatota archaeon]